MASGSQHYAEAERLLGLVLDADGTPPMESYAEGGFGATLAAQSSTWRDQTLAAAQVHATLALAAAADSGPRRTAEWHEAIKEES